MQNQTEQKQFKDNEDQRKNKQFAPSRNCAMLPLDIYRTIMAEYLEADDLVRFSILLVEMSYVNPFSDAFWQKKLTSQYQHLLKTLPARKDEYSQAVNKLFQSKKYRKTYEALQTTTIAATDLQKTKVLNVLTLLKVAHTKERQDRLSHFLSEVTWLMLISARISSSGLQHLAKALETNQTLRELNLCNNQIDPFKVEYLATALAKNQTLISLNLELNPITNAGIKYLAEALEDNHTLKELRLTRTQIIDCDGARYLAKAVSKNQGLVILNLSENYINDDGVRYLAEALKENKVLMELNLFENRTIGDLGAQYLSYAFETNQTLLHLSLRANQIGNLGALFLSYAIQKNQTLINLNLAENRINENGAQYLISALENQNTLVDLCVGCNQCYGGHVSINALIQRNCDLQDRCIEALKSKDKKTVQNLLHLNVSPNGVLMKLIKEVGYPKEDDIYYLTPIQLLFQIAQNKITRGTVFEATRSVRYKNKPAIVSFLQFGSPNILEEETKPTAQTCCIV